MYNFLAAEEPEFFSRVGGDQNQSWKWLMDLHSLCGQKHDSEWMLMLLSVQWMCK